MEACYKLDIDSTSSQTSNRFIEGSSDFDIEDRQHNYFLFKNFCAKINEEYKLKDLSTIANAFDEFSKFIDSFPMNYFENISTISENNIPLIFFDCLHIDKPFAILYSCISLLIDLLFHCVGAFQLFCTEEFVSLLIKNVKSNSGTIRNEHITALSNILFESDQQMHENILNLISIDYIINMINSNEQDEKFIENSFNFINNAIRFSVPPETSQSILFISNKFFSKFPKLVLEIYVKLVKIQKVYDGFDYQSININILRIDSKIDNDLINECLIFIHFLIKNNSNLRKSFDVEKIAFFALCPVDSEQYDNQLKYNALLVLYDIGVSAKYIKNLITQFNDLTNKCKKAAGNIIFDFAKNVNLQNTDLLVADDSNIFSIARDLLSSYTNIKQAINIFLAMQHFLEVTEFSENTLDLISNEFPGDTIWHFVNTKNEEIHQVGMNFINSYLKAVEMLE